MDHSTHPTQAPADPNPFHHPPTAWPHPALSEEALAVKRTPVVSSFISSVGYDVAKKWMVMAFKSGMVYVYIGVPHDVYSRFMGAESKGRFYNKVIRHHYSISEAGLASGREEVRSTAIRAVGYNEAKNVLEIEFGSGDVYRYTDVPKSVFQALERAPSPGAYFNRFIRDLYPHEEEHEDAAADVDLEEVLDFGPRHVARERPRPRVSALAE